MTSRERASKIAWSHYAGEECTKASVTQLEQEIAEALDESRAEAFEEAARRLSKWLLEAAAEWSGISAPAASSGGSMASKLTQAEKHRRAGVRQALRAIANTHDDSNISPAFCDGFIYAQQVIAEAVRALLAPKRKKRGKEAR